MASTKRAAKRRAATRANRAKAKQAAAAKAQSTQAAPTKSVVVNAVQGVPGWLWAALAALGGFALVLLALWLRARRNGGDTVNVLDTADPTTGFANRDAFESRLAEEWRRANTFEHDLGLMIVEFEGFRKLTAKLDQEQLDQTLQQVASVMRRCVHTTDFLAHPYDDQFAVICPSTDISALVDLRGSIERAFEADESLKWEADIGIAEIEPSDTDEHEVVNRARDAVNSRHDAKILAFAS